MEKPCVPKIPGSFTRISQKIAWILPDGLALKKSGRFILIWLYYVKKDDF